jgi:hypothetical protein
MYGLQFPAFRFGSTIIIHYIDISKPILTISPICVDVRFNESAANIYAISLTKNDYGGTINF